MKRKIKISVVLLLSVLFFSQSLATSIKAEAYGTLKCPNGHVGFPQKYVYNTTYPNADNYAHQRVDYCAYICDVCSAGWTGTESYSEPHSTPNNEACACGFVPPH